MFCVVHAHTQLPGTADVCLLAGVLRSHEWLRQVVLDGNPIDEAGLGHLCRALLRNRRVQSISLNRCGLGERSGVLLLRLLGEKPGLEVEVGEGNPFGEEITKKVNYCVKRCVAVGTKQENTDNKVPLNELELWTRRHRRRVRSYQRG